ncbi:exopolysaccharide biosynthesis polyprenyl glycosylphosphotransferase [Vicingaceae bacterium]|nr:exopolysaccharide biosynthesis polyprenyl glycosylphosphotransferase [Vicingaceae bacterium]
MPKIALKYLHFFIFSTLLDISLISLFELLGGDSFNMSSILILWVVVKLILYPSKSVRRYVGLEKVLKQGFKQIVLFGIIYSCFSLFIDTPLVLISKHFLLLGIAVVVSKTFFVFALKIYRSYGYSYNRFIIIGAFPEKDKIIDYLTKNPRTGNQFVDYFKNLNEVGDLQNYIIKNEIKEIYCHSQLLSNVELSRLMRVSLKNDIALSLLADDNIKAINDLGENVTDIVDLSLLMSRRNLILKRVFDLLISITVILFVLSWLIPIVGLIIKLDSKGPVFFIQPRAGKGAVYFYCIKFRSMKPASGDAQATKNDSRITKVGKFLRESSLDEFPQFINVFLGDMSIVGPRPHIKSLNDKYDSKIQGYFNRLLVKPGITGLSQVAGYRGETKDQQSMQNRIRVDLLYIKNWAPSLDLKIFLRTFFKTFFSKDNQAY